MRLMISICPEYCDKIFTYKEKNLELRKNYPTKIELPFTAYVYCTAEKWKITEVIHKGESVWGDAVWEHDTPLFIKIPDAPAHMFGKCKKVIGEILIDRIVEVSRENGRSMINGKELTKEDKLYTGVTVRAFDKYRGEKPFLYGWHIAETKLYEKPKELPDFGMKHPPQSWCYVEKLPRNERKRC